jgi:hypothetical protein
MYINSRQKDEASLAEGNCERNVTDISGSFYDDISHITSTIERFVYNRHVWWRMIAS